MPLTLRCPSGEVRLETNLLLAPIAGWCDLAWRETCRSVRGPRVEDGTPGGRTLGGVGLACTDLLSPKGLLADDDTTRDLARTSEFDRPIGMQLYGSDPQILADGARWCADHGATVVDINMGCPVDKVCKKDGGSMLMCNLPNTLRLFEAVRAALPDHVPLTAKMRLGWSESDYERGVAGELAVGLCERGAAMIVVHGRTTEQRFRGECRREGIRRVVETVGEATGAYDGTTGGGVPVVGNGDVRTAEDALGMLNETGCAGVMIGRGAFARPWVFADAWARQMAWQSAMGNRQWGDREDSAKGSSDCRLPIAYCPTEDEKLDLVLAYFARMREYRGDHYAMHIIRQKISWLGKGINDSHCGPLKEAVRTAKDPAAVVAAVEGWRDSHRDLGPRAGLRDGADPGPDRCVPSAIE